VAGAVQCNTNNTSNIPVSALMRQDEISVGFDRLLAMASEVDKRRKSAENSPAQVGAAGSWLESSQQWTV
jgi:hypothetical protein